MEKGWERDFTVVSARCGDRSENELKEKEYKDARFLAGLSEKLW